MPVIAKGPLYLCPSICLSVCISLAPNRRICGEKCNARNFH